MTPLPDALREVLETAVEFAGADFGNIQVLDPEGHLRILVHQGFPDEWVDSWNSVDLGQGACGTSLALGERVIVEDVEQSPIFAGTPALDIQRRTGVRAVQSTPVVAPSGQVLGMLSTHYRRPHRPDAKTQRLLDLLAAHAATLIGQAGTRVPQQLREDRFRTVVEDQTEAISRFLPDGTFTFVNEVYCQLFGKSPAELIGQRWQPVVHPDDLPNIEARLRGMSPEHPVAVIENRVHSHSGGVRWMQFVNRGFFGADGALMSIQSVGRDITSLKQIEEDLREIEQRLEMALAGSNLALWDWNLATGQIAFGDRWYAMLGYPADGPAWHVDQWRKIFEPDDLKRVEAALAEHLAGNSAVLETEHRLRHREGHWVTVRASGRVTQRKILGLIAGGMTSAQIGDRLKIATNTVIAHRQRMMAKLDLHSTAQVVRFAVDHGLVTR